MQLDLTLERFDDAMVPNQEGIGNEGERREIDIAPAVANQLDEPAVASKILPLRLVDENPIAVAEPCSAGIELQGSTKIRPHSSTSARRCHGRR